LTISVAPLALVMGFFRFTDQGIPAHAKSYA
jgi:hypothetical protein